MAVTLYSVCSLANAERKLDSLTQAALGAGIAGALAPPRSRRRAMLLGAMLGTLPDLDVLIDYGDDVANFTRHRGFSHSLFVLAPLSVLLWAMLQWRWEAVRGAPGRWLAVIVLALCTHPLLDCHTAYGTQLFWPVDMPPIKWATIFIIDPAYTLPLIAAGVYAAWRPTTAGAQRALLAGLGISSLYLAWTWYAQALVRNDALAALDAAGIEARQVFVTPAPLNSVLWRVVAMTDDGYLEAFDSLFLDEPEMCFRPYRSDVDSLAAASGVAAVSRLDWFAGGFVKSDVIDNTLHIADLRMGHEPIYVFTHAVARRVDGRWQAIVPVRLPVSLGDRSLGEVWERIWSETSAR